MGNILRSTSNVSLNFSETHLIKFESWLKIFNLATLDGKWNLINFVITSLVLRFKKLKSYFNIRNTLKLFIKVLPSLKLYLIKFYLIDLRSEKYCETVIVQEV